MGNIDEINRVIERAKSQRAEMIGSAVQSAAIPGLLVAVCALVLVQLNGETPSAPVASAPTAQVASASTR